MVSYLPDGMLDSFVAEYLRCDAYMASDDPGPFIRDELSPHRNTKTVFAHRYRNHGIIAKVYDEVDAGESAFAVSLALCMQGFGPDTHHRTPEPLAYLPEHRAFLMEPAAGICLLPLALRDPVACEEGMWHAARWLAHLHAAPVRVGPEDYPVRILYRLARKVVRAVAHLPDLVSRVTKLLIELSRRGDAYAALGPQPLVQTHGRYHCGHVFVTSDAVTVIDLDRAAIGDPAKDVGEFLCRFRIEASKEAAKRRLSQDLGSFGSRIFAEEYGGAVPLPHSGLLYYWSATLLGLLLDSTLKQHLGDDVRRARLVAHETGFALLPELVAELV